MRPTDEQVRPLAELADLVDDQTTGRMFVSAIYTQGFMELKFRKRAGSMSLYIPQEDGAEVLTQRIDASHLRAFIVRLALRAKEPSRVGLVIDTGKKACSFDWRLRTGSGERLVGRVILVTSQSSPARHLRYGYEPGRDHTHRLGQLGRAWIRKCWGAEVLRRA